MIIITACRESAPTYSTPRRTIMCDQHVHALLPLTEAASKKRLKLWDLKPHLHCAMLGTCLTMAEVRKLVRQSGIAIPANSSDHVLHSSLVNAAGSNNRAAKNLHKFLDRKYRRWIQNTASMVTGRELIKHWRAVMETGDIAGSFWALMTHPCCGLELMREAYADVHMMSHLQGASNRADLKRLQKLESEVAELRGAMLEQRRNHHQQLSCRDEILRSQEHELQALRVRQAQLMQKTPEDDTASLRQDETLEKRLDWAEGRLVEREMQSTHLREELSALKANLKELRAENQTLEQTVNLLLRKHTHGQEDAMPPIDLHGKQILYVGGRPRLAPYLRSLVEAHNGRFNHHDGGLEDSRAGLQNTLAAADMVFCPIDCISHDACLRVKKHCHQQAKLFVPLRSSGLSAFASGLRNLASCDARQEEQIN
jgi:hypothetical protein